MFGFKKNTKGASVPQQKRWGRMTPNKKSFMRKLLPDRDGDKVPDLFDCRPFNRKRQEEYDMTGTEFEKEKKRYMDRLKDEGTGNLDYFGRQWEKVTIQNKNIDWSK